MSGEPASLWMVFFGVLQSLDSFGHSGCPSKIFFYYSISVNCIVYWVGAVHLKHWLSLQNKKIKFVDFYIYPPFNGFLKFSYFNNFCEILYLKKFTYVHMLKHPPLSGYDVKHETINQSSFLRDH